MLSMVRWFNCGHVRAFGRVDVENPLQERMWRRFAKQTLLALLSLFSPTCCKKKQIQTTFPQQLAQTSDTSKWNHLPFFISCPTEPPLPLLFILSFHVQLNLPFPLGGSQLDNNCFSGSLQRTVELYLYFLFCVHCLILCMIVQLFVVNKYYYYYYYYYYYFPYFFILFLSYFHSSKLVLNSVTQFSQQSLIFLMDLGFWKIYVSWLKDHVTIKLGMNVTKMFYLWIWEWSETIVILWPAVSHNPRLTGTPSTIIELV